MNNCVHRALCPNECPCDYYEKEKRMKIKHWIDCHIRHEHIYDLGPDVDKWEENIKRQVEADGFVEARCMYCGELLFTIGPNEVKGETHESQA